MSSLRLLPSVDRLLQSELAGLWAKTYGRPATLQAVRDVLEQVRASYREGQAVPGEADLLERAGQILEKWMTPTLQPVINASGVILHTNLGRAPLSPAAIQEASAIAAGYSTLEYDLEKGRRGSRLVHAEGILKQLTGAEAALVVNNNAAAVLLALTALARRRAVVIARTQLVEIGGGFRVPDVMKQSGARLIEVGTTNQVHLSDYEAAMEEKPALFFHAHRSNFALIGFTGEPDLDKVVGIAHQAGIPLVDDQGSGALLDTARYGMAHEPTVQEALAAGVDLVCFSGDKLLGGPQTGIIVGRAEYIERLKKHPLARAVRADKLCLAALSATLLHYLKDEAEQKIPVWRMISMPAEIARQRAESWAAVLGQGMIQPGESTVGGGSLPGETLPTFLLALKIHSPNSFLSRLRHGKPAIIARLEDDYVLFDPRSILPEQDGFFVEGLMAALGGV